MIYMHKHKRLGGSGGMFPHEIFLKLDSLRLLLRPFWNRNRAVVATWLTALCVVSIVFWPSPHMHLLCQPTLNFLRLTEQQVG